MIGDRAWMLQEWNISEGRVCDVGQSEVVYCCAYREIDADKKSGGGPGGVLKLMQSLMPSEIDKKQLKYISKPLRKCVPDEVWEKMDGIHSKVKSVLCGAGYIATNNEIIKSINEGKNPCFVCHDMGSAYGAYLLGAKYIVIYHQQGSIISEIESSGCEANKYDCEILEYIDRVVMTNATSVYFPSRGAKSVYFNSRDVVVTENECNADKKPLYNTIVDIESSTHELALKVDEDDICFLSIGDFNYAKGMDLVPEFLKEYQNVSGIKVHWVAIGRQYNGQYFDIAKKKCEEYGIKHTLIGERVDHAYIIDLMERADYYIMLHRKSIFDLSILEAMNLGMKIILSECLSNEEFNVNDNIILVPNSDDLSDCIEQIINNDAKSWEQANKNAFEYFNADKFVERYTVAIKELIVSQ